MRSALPTTGGPVPPKIDDCRMGDRALPVAWRLLPAAAAAGADRMLRRHGPAPKVSFRRTAAPATGAGIESFTGSGYTLPHV
ncbi:hypothetical protein DIPPA_04760 [Diplonema papillatum]|nr:hypothetical protein DIPPA_04760 [Diplonema papillatum]